MKKSTFPIAIFVLYVLYYAGEAAYSSYVNLYLDGIGLSKAQIGLSITMATLVALTFQSLWGLASDRARSKNVILMILFSGTSLTVLLYYTTTVYWQIAAIIILMSFFYFPIIPLQDNLSLERIEGTGWDFGRVRLGGTLGYAITALLVGIWIQDRYGNIFIMVSVIHILCLITLQFIPRVAGHRHGKTAGKAPIRVIFRDRTLVGLMIFQIFYTLGSSLYYSYYPIYFTTIGGNSTLLGIMFFVAAMAELPFLFMANRLVSRFGIGKIIAVSGLSSGLRWLMLFFLHDPRWVIAACLLNVFGFVSISYCIVTYINEHVPKDLRATSQTVSSLLNLFFARILFGYLGGLASDLLGVNNIMLLSSVMIFIVTTVFTVWLWKTKRLPGRARHPLEQ